MKKNLFAYGSLMLPEIFSRVAQETRSSIPATLNGWKRCQVAGQSYPAIVTAPAESVPGLLWIGLSDSALTRLDAFEGEEYRRIVAEVVDAAGVVYFADTYAWALEGGLLDAPWDFEWFQTEGIKRFSRLYL
ncbi:MAG: gamma-glutamylcyclotransferase family protein [Burkholderiaceae bacterium]